MASRTQIRLEQLTGSAVDLKTEAQQYVTPAAASALTGSDIRDLFGMVGAALNRIHGADSSEPFNNTAGQLKDSGGTLRFNYADNSTTEIRDSGGTVRLGASDSGNVVIRSNAQAAIATFADSAFTFTQDSTFNNNVTIDGNLTVSGDTTTINTTNLNVEDSIIGLGFSGSNPSTLGDRGILFGRAAIGQAIPGLWYDETNSDFNFATSITDPSSGSFGATTAYQNLNAGNVAVYSTTTEVGSLTTDVDGNFALSGSAGGDISLESSGLNIFLKAAEFEYGKIKMETDLVLSSSVDTGLTLDANSGKIVFGKGFDTGPNGVGVGAFISSAGAGQESLRIATSDKSAADATTNYLLDINASNTFANSFMALSGALRLLGDNGASNYVALKSPNSLGSSYTLTLPGNNGDPSQYLQTDGNGTLTWASVAAAADSLSKAIRIITGSHAAGAEVKIGAVAEITAGDAITGLSIAGSQGKALDVFVNGQLLISGSQSERSAGTRDYNIVADPTNSLEFAFQLEADDVVVVVKRDN